MRLCIVLFTFLLTSCSASVGGFYATPGSHPHISFAVKGTVGPVEALHAPTTQRGANDLYMVGVYPTLGTGLKLTGGAGWAWWRAWGACDETGYNCEHPWTDGVTGGLGLVYESGHARLDLRYQVFADAPFKGALLFTAGVRP